MNNASASLDDRIIQGEDLRTYAFDRKIHPDMEIQSSQIATLQRVFLHNAFRTEEVEQFLRNAGIFGKAVKYSPKKSSEPHFYFPDSGDLHVVNTRDIVRLQRDQELVQALSEVLGREIQPIINHYGNDPVTAANRFEQFAYELVRDISKTFDENAIRKKGKIIIVMGPHQSFPAEPHETKKELKGNDYLDYRILQVGDETVINLDYIFAGQAEHVLRKIYTMLGARFEGIDVDIYHYGKIGALNRGLGLGQVCTPTGAIDERKILSGQTRISPVYNELVTGEKASQMFKELVGEEPKIGPTINTTSVLQQTRQNLLKCLEAGGQFLDMEWAAIAGLDHGASSCYPGLGTIRYYFAGIVSDIPLEDKTLGGTQYTREKERKVAESFRTLITES